MIAARTWHKRKIRKSEMRSAVFRLREVNYPDGERAAYRMPPHSWKQVGALTTTAQFCVHHVREAASTSFVSSVVCRE